MSKTIETQIAKSRMLISGFRKKIDTLSDKGVNESLLTDMETDLKSLEVLNDECEELREKLKEKIKEVNVVLDKEKQLFFNLKKTVKSNYPQELWIDYGITDKR